MAKLLVALKRNRRGTAPGRWVESVRQLPGVKVQGTTSPERIQVEIDDELIPKLQQTVGEFCHIEPIILHHPLQPNRAEE
jgi:hypothetical protein